MSRDTESLITDAAKQIIDQMVEETKLVTLTGRQQGRSLGSKWPVMTSVDAAAVGAAEEKARKDILDSLTAKIARAPVAVGPYRNWIADVENIAPLTEIEQLRRDAERKMQEEVARARREQMDLQAKKQKAAEQCLAKVGQVLSYIRAMRDMGVTGFHGDMWDELAKLYNGSLGNFDDA